MLRFALIPWEARLPGDLQQTTLGQYQIIERVGAGGMGTVYRGYQPALDRSVAIKVLPRNDARDARFYERFRLEARAIARLDHPNILPVFDFGEHEGLLYIVMPLVTGGTLKDRMRTWMPLERVLPLLEPVADALDYAHSQGVIHRDVKPANILVNQANRPLLADFGLAKLLEDAPALTGTGVGLGTPQYMSPEQCMGQQVDARTDQYALGVMIFEMLAGRVPYAGASAVEVLLKHVNEAVPHIRAVNPLVLDTVDQVLTRALAKRPEDRFGSCRELMQALRDAAASRPADLGATLTSASAPIADEPADSGPPPYASWPAASSPAESGAMPTVATDAASTGSPGVEGVATPAPAPRPVWGRVARAARPTPRRAALAVVLLAFIFAGPAIATLRQPAVQPMTGIFNLAVAEFGQVNDRGETVRWENGSRLGKSIADRLEVEIQRNAELTGLLQVRHEGIGQVTGNSFGARVDAASRVAEQLRAQLVAYGNVERRGSQTVFSPEFYVTGVKGAEELLGSNRLGTPIVAEGRDEGLGYALILSDTLRARSEALTYLAIGLTYLTIGQPGNAVTFFERSRDVQPWADNEGKEVVYIFLGNAYLARSQDGDVERSRNAFLTAARLNPEYARAYIGLGNVAYEEFNRSERTDAAALEQAIREYERARAAKLKPETAFADARIHVNLGNAYVVKGQAGDPSAFARAEDEYQQLIAEFERGRTELRELAAQAYLGVGLVADFASRDPRRAAEYYRKTISLASGNKKVEQIAHEQLAELERAAQ